MHSLSRAILGVLLFASLSCDSNQQSGQGDGSDNAEPVIACLPADSAAGNSTMMTGHVYMTKWSDEAGAWVVDQEFYAEDYAFAATWKESDDLTSVYIDIANCADDDTAMAECTNLPPCGSDSIQLSIDVNGYAGSYAFPDPAYGRMEWFDGEQCVANPGTLNIESGAPGESVIGSFSFTCASNSSGSLEGTFSACNCGLIE